MSLRKTPSISNSSTPLKHTVDQLERYNMESNEGNASNTTSGATAVVDDVDDDKRGKKRAPPTSGTKAKILQTIGLKPYNAYEAPPIQSTTAVTAAATAPSSGSSLPSSSNTTTTVTTTVTTKSPRQLPPPFVIQVTAIASLGGVLFGYDMGVIAGALPQLATTFQLKDSQQELVVSILYLGGGLGAAVGGSLCDMFGRKPAIMWTDIAFMVGATVLFVAPHPAWVCLGRVIVGFAVAVSGIADVSYLHEIAPKQWRGAIVSVNEACISLGFLMAFIVGEIFDADAGTGAGTTSDNNNNNNENESSHHPPQGWRYMFGLGGVMAAIQFLGMWNMPESPVWLKDKGRIEESNAALQRIHGHGDDIIEEEDPEHPQQQQQQHHGQTTENNYSSHPRNSSTTSREDYYNQQQRQRDRSETPPQSSTEEGFIYSSSSYESLSPDRRNHSNNNGSGSLDHGPANHPSNQCYTVTHSAASFEAPESTALRGPALWLHEICLWKYQLKAAMGHLRFILQRYRRQVWIALFLSVTQQFCGQTNVLNYAPSILKAVLKQGGDEDQELSAWSTLSIGLVKFIVTVLVIWKIESIGRRSLLLFGMGTIAFGLLLVAVAFSGGGRPSIEETEQEQDNEVVVRSGSGFYFALPGVLLVVSGYSMSFGPLTWLLTSELFPTDIRGRALGASTIITYLCASTVTYSFLTAQSVLGTSTVFSMYMLITIAGVAFACVAIPDTGGKTMEEIDVDLARMPWWNRQQQQQRDRFQSSSRKPTLRKRQSQSGSGSNSGGGDGNHSTDPLSPTNTSITCNPPHRLLRPTSSSRGSSTDVGELT